MVVVVPYLECDAGVDGLGGGDDVHEVADEAGAVAHRVEVLSVRALNIKAPTLVYPAVASNQETVQFNTGCFIKLLTKVNITNLQYITYLYPMSSHPFESMW